jgi:hypothetical protein
LYVFFLQLLDMSDPGRGTLKISPLVQSHT